MSQEPNKTSNQSANLPNDVAGQFRSLTDAELHGVSGGAVNPFVVMAAGYALGALVGYAWDLPIGATTQDAAAALGMSHLL